MAFTSILTSEYGVFYGNGEARERDPLNLYVMSWQTSKRCLYENGQKQRKQKVGEVNANVEHRTGFSIGLWIALKRGRQSCAAKALKATFTAELQSHNSRPGCMLLRKSTQVDH